MSVPNLTPTNFFYPLIFVGRDLSQTILDPTTQKPHGNLELHYL